MTEKQYVRLKIVSESLPNEEITRLLGIEPDNYWRPGDTRGKTSALHKNFGWILNSSLTEEFPIDAHIAELLRVVEPATAQIYSISSKADICFSCAVYCSSAPPLFFDKETVFKISALGASLDIDLYLSDG